PLPDRVDGRVLHLARDRLRLVGAVSLIRRLPSIDRGEHQNPLLSHGQTDLEIHCQTLSIPGQAITIVGTKIRIVRKTSHLVSRRILSVRELAPIGERAVKRCGALAGASPAWGIVGTPQ